MERMMKTLTLLLATAAGQQAQAQTKQAPYAQTVLESVAKRHSDVREMELAARRGDGCVTVAATDAGDIGDSCDRKERDALRSGNAYVEDPSRRDPVYIITEQLHDSQGAVIGLIIVDLDPRGESRDTVLARARGIRQEVESRITSASQLLGDAGARTSATPDRSYKPRLDPQRFVSTVTNPYFPLVPGT